MTEGRTGAGTPEPPGPRNEVTGDTGAVVQTGSVHGDVHITSSAASPAAATPRQLPLSVTGFVNRSDEIALLDALISDEDGAAAGQAGGAVVISAIGGTPGIGKTALAVHWAHRVRSRYADGDLYVNLHGHGPGPRLDTAQALGSLLRALGAPPDQIPLDLDGRAALYRSHLAHKRMLIVIDDAVSADQVRPLLPAAPGCLVLVTSRSTLSGLVAREGARRMTLDALSTGEALTLFREVAGAERIDAEPEAAHTLVAHCDHLPLALRILAARIIGSPHSPLSAFAADLATEDRRLDILGTGDDELSDVRAVFADSYSALPADAARLFRRIGTHPGGEISAHACAVSIECAVADVRPVLGRLIGASLVQQVGRDRYRLHDLLRLYAVERFHADEPADSRTVVISRFAAWYLRSAGNAVRWVLPNFPLADVTGPVPEPPTPPPAFESTDAALAWFDQERTNLVGTAHTARALRADDLAWRMAVTVAPLLDFHNHRDEWRDIAESGLAAARAIDHRYGAARARISLADFEKNSGDTDAAIAHYEALIEADADDWITGFALRTLGSIRWNRHDGDEARALLRRSIDTFRRSGERRGEGMALLSLAECERSTGRFSAGLKYCAAATAIFTETTDTWTIAWSRCFTGRTLISAGRHTDAVAEYTTALQVFRDLGDSESESIALVGLGDAYAALGDTESARSHLGAALDLRTAADVPGTEEIKATLARIPRPA
ncbi:tetratricopeptide repeat protein [Murinocardiopsis flavida]|uniref:Tetratricopeptide repeat protein n=1 Tax=Murinocardiopsis flavida TaxID=645275 RepID=A0A2P8CZ77_9ACTN|nr:tetratricopeptide repeat protein [Murinocardiopsis flavida]PSK90263.1 tetratricopeptide repeat protein [Murinocardiopsis flavida]